MLTETEVEDRVLARLKPFAEAFVTITTRVLDGVQDHCPFRDPRNGQITTLQRQAAAGDFRLVSIIRSRLMEAQFAERARALDRLARKETLPVEEMQERMQRTAYLLLQVQKADPLRYQLKMSTMQVLNPDAYAVITKGISTDLSFYEPGGE